MITQRQFSEIHVSFWELICPNMHRLVRSINMSGRHVFDSPMPATVDTSRTFAINEFAFEVYCNVDSGKTSTKSDIMSRVISQFSSDNNISDIIPELSDEEVFEASTLAARIRLGIPPYARRDTPVTYRPPFTGVGLLSDCQGDIRYGNTLIEIKSGERNLRTSDFRQVITYYVLSVLSEENPIGSCLILNARQGYRCYFDFSDLIETTSGMPLVEFTASFRDYLVDWKMCD
jgi:hypothetical protein